MLLDTLNCYIFTKKNFQYENQPPQLPAKKSRAIFWQIHNFHLFCCCQIVSKGLYDPTPKLLNCQWNFGYKSKKYLYCQTNSPPTDIPGHCSENFMASAFFPLLFALSRYSQPNKTSPRIAGWFCPRYILNKSKRA